MPSCPSSRRCRKAESTVMRDVRDSVACQVLEVRASAWTAALKPAPPSLVVVLPEAEDRLPAPMMDCAKSALDPPASNSTTWTPSRTAMLLRTLMRAVLPWPLMPWMPSRHSSPLPCWMPSIIPCRISNSFARPAKTGGMTPYRKANSNGGRLWPLCDSRAKFCSFNTALPVESASANRGSSVVQEVSLMPIIMRQGAGCGNFPC